MVFVFLLLFSIGQAAAQSPDSIQPFRIGIGIGGSFTGFREETVAPINRFMNAFTFIIDGNIEKSSLLHTFNINFFTGNARMTAPYRGYIHENNISTRGSMEYALNYRLWGNHSFPGYLGGSFRSAVYLNNIDDTERIQTPTGYGLFSFGLHATQKWIIDAKNTLTLTAGFPVFGYAIRPPYAMTNDLWEKYIIERTYLKIISLGGVTSIHNYRAIFGDIKYQYKLNTLLSLYSGFGFEYLRINFNRPRVDAISRLNAGIAFAF